MPVIAVVYEFEGFFRGEWTVIMGALGLEGEGREFQFRDRGVGTADLKFCYRVLWFFG